MPGRMEFELGLGRSAAPRRAAGAPMRLLILGDFSGAPMAERRPLAQRPTHAVDVDSLDTTPAPPVAAVVALLADTIRERAGIGSADR